MGPWAKFGGNFSSKFVQKLWLGPPLPRSNSVPRCSSPSGPPEPSNRHFLAFLANLALFGRPWAKIGGNHALPVGLKIPAYMSRNSFQLRSTPFQPFRTSRALTVRFWPFLGNLGPFWVNFGPWRSQKWSQKRALLGTRLRVPRQMRNKCLFTPNEKKISDPPPYPIVGWGATRQNINKSSSTKLFLHL